MPENQETSIGDIQATLAQRGNRYGSFANHARIAQNIKAAMADSPNWTALAPDQREALEMLAHKTARILNGDPDYHDSWHDIVGYAQLVGDRILKDQQDQSNEKSAIEAAFIAFHAQVRGSPAARASASGAEPTPAEAHYDASTGEPLDLKFAVKEAAQ